MAKADIRFCGSCGASLTPDARFCGACGRASTTADADRGPVEPDEDSGAESPVPLGPVPGVEPTPTAVPQPAVAASPPVSTNPAGLPASTSDNGSPDTPPASVTGIGPPGVGPDRRQRRIVWGAAVAVVVIAGIVTAVLLFRQSPPTRVVIDTPQSADATQPPATEPASTSTSDTDGTSTTLAGQVADQPARPLQSLLQNSTADRSAIVSATSDIGSCGDLAADVQTLTTAATNRQELLTQLTGLDLSALPTGSQLVSTLTAAWQASIQSDTDYASWGTDLEQSGCTGQAPTSDPNWQSAQSSDTSATFAKYEFVTLWNPIAGTEGLTEYQYGQL